MHTVLGRSVGEAEQRLTTSADRAALALATAVAVASIMSGIITTGPSLFQSFGLLLALPLFLFFGVVVGGAHVAAACLAWWVLHACGLRSSLTACVVGALTGAGAYAWPGRAMFFGPRPDLAADALRCTLFVITGAACGLIVHRIAYRPARPPTRSGVPVLTFSGPPATPADV